MLASWNDIKNKELPLHRAIIADILLWFLLALLLSLGIYIFAILIPESQGERIKLHFNDVNEVSKGTSVTMMGTEIGYVKDLYLHRGHVDVIIQTYTKKLPIPSGSTFTIVFTGLGGSKSVDVDLPPTPYPWTRGKPRYHFQDPIRLKTLLDYGIAMTQALQKGAENITDFFGKKKPVEELQFNIHQAHQWSLESLDYANITIREMGNFRKDMGSNSQGGIQTMTDFSNKARELTRCTQPERIRPMVFDTLHKVKGIQHYFAAQNPQSLPNRMAQVYTFNGTLNAWIGQTHTKVKGFNLTQFLDRVDAGETRFLEAMDNANTFFSRNRKQELNAFRTNVRAFNQAVLEWSLKLDQMKVVKPPKNQSSPTSNQQPMQPCPAPHQPSTPNQPNSSFIGNFLKVAWDSLYWLFTS